MFKHSRLQLHAGKQAFSVGAVENKGGKNAPKVTALTETFMYRVISVCPAAQPTALCHSL